MFIVQRILLIVKELFSNRFISLIVLFSVVCSAMIVGIFDTAGDSLNRYIRDRFAGSLPPDTIKVSVPAEKFDQLLQAGGDIPGISEAAAGRIRRMKGVSIVHPVMPVKVPMQAGVYFFGFGFRVDVPAVGVPLALVKDGIGNRDYLRLWRGAKKGSLIPVIVTRPVLHAYNDIFAGPNGLPRFSEKGILGFRFTLTFGRSTIKSVADSTDEDAVVAGFIGSPNLLALVVPITVAEEFNSRFHKGYRKSYLNLFVKVKSHESLLIVAGKIREMRLNAETGTDLSEGILRLERNVSLTLAAMKYLIMLISAVAVIFSTIIATVNRIDYYRIVRIVGGSKVFIAMTILVKHFIIGLAGALIATELLRQAAVTLASSLQIPELSGTIVVSGELRRTLLLYGVLLPVLSTVPSLFRLYTRALNRD